MGPKSDLDAIIISDSGLDTLSGTNPLKLHLDGRVGDIQVIHNYIQHNGHVTLPVKGDNELSWSSAPKLNGIYLTSFLTAQGFNFEMIQNYTNEKERFTHLLSQNPRSVILSTSFIFFKKDCAISPLVLILIYTPLDVLQTQPLRLFFNASL